MHAPPDFHLDAGNLPALNDQFAQLGWLTAGERLLGAQKAGEGNMNLTLRLETSVRSLILKQSRGWVEKYPQIAAPRDRVVVEGAFYTAIQTHPELAKFMPRLLGFDAATRLLLIEDLGPAADYTSLYGAASADHSDFTLLVSFIAGLHRTFHGVRPNPLFENRDMRRLNHEHIFDLPLRRANALDLDRITPGLAGLAAQLQNNAGYVEQVRTLGIRYLEDGPTLVHGDYFPGSWLKTPAGPRVIDPEFCFYGPPEFDLGVMHAHMLFAATGFDALAAYEGPFDARLARQFAGVEIMRRLIGVAQLPLERSLEEKAALLAESRRLVLA